MKGKFVRIKNMSKEQLCKLKVWDFCYGFPGPKTFRDLRETAPSFPYSSGELKYAFFGCAFIGLSCMMRWLKNICNMPNLHFLTYLHPS